MMSRKTSVLSCFLQHTYLFYTSKSYVRLRQYAFALLSSELQTEQSLPRWIRRGNSILLTLSFG